MTWSRAVSVKSLQSLNTTEDLEDTHREDPYVRQEIDRYNKKDTTVKWQCHDIASFRWKVVRT